jgi:hypothetical protein
MPTTLVRTAWRITPFKKQVKRRIYSRWNPSYWLRLGRACSILGFKYGLLDSMIRGASIAQGGEAIPWYTYSATEFLKQFDFSGANVFEYGCGNSTLFWGSRARRVVSVEHERRWHDQVRTMVPANVELIYAGGPEEYVGAVDRFPEYQYDVIVIDGQSRLLCAKQAVSRLSQTGFVILDNSDWFPRRRCCGTPGCSKWTSSDSAPSTTTRRRRLCTFDALPS